MESDTADDSRICNADFDHFRLDRVSLCFVRIQATNMELNCYNGISLDGSLHLTNVSLFSFFLFFFFLFFNLSVIEIVPKENGISNGVVQASSR